MNFNIQCAFTVETLYSKSIIEYKKQREYKISHSICRKVDPVYLSIAIQHSIKFNSWKVSHHNAFIRPKFSLLGQTNNLCSIKIHLLKYQIATLSSIKQISCICIYQISIPNITFPLRFISILTIVISLFMF